ncbi:TetR/AcrR family transcriptional regulator [Nocardia sp. NPDC060220]|uniref:TetR/AcrR family transcriptional regulator n=1 Tax=Nocardia sp. NPDC060220 TaxID=3347076 RepID=UPI00364CC54F
MLASQRGRLGWAALNVVAEKGYQQTTVSDIVKRAEVSRRTFYELFAGKEDCYVAAFEFTVEVVQNMLNSALQPYTDLDWTILVQKSLQEYLVILADEPNLARALHVEALAVGPALAVHRAGMKKVFVDRMRRVHGIGVAQGELSGNPREGVLDLLIGGIDDRIRDCIDTTGPQGLPGIAPDLTTAAIALIRASAEPTL